MDPFPGKNLQFLDLTLRVNPSVFGHFSNEQEAGNKT
jgi:hypothetical protein